MYRVGVDLGGTNIKLGLVDKGGRILDQSSHRTLVKNDANEIIERIIGHVKALLERNKIDINEIKGLGVGSPGIIEEETGVVLYSNNFGWEHVQLKAALENGLGLTVKVANDANCAVLGEQAAGAAKGCRSVVLLTLGTGVGSGILVNGELIGGSGGIAGHMTIRRGGRLCSCGKAGCLEVYASATALIGETRRAMCPESKIYELCQGDPARIDGCTAFEAAKAGDSCGKRIVEEYIDALADGIGGLVNLFRPEKVLLSGGICNEGDELLALLNPKLPKYCFANRYLPVPPVEVAMLKNTAGIIGAALLF